MARRLPPVHCLRDRPQLEAAPARRRLLVRSLRWPLIAAAVCAGPVAPTVPASAAGPLRTLATTHLSFTGFDPNVPAGATISVIQRCPQGSLLDKAATRGRYTDLDAQLQAATERPARRPRAVGCRTGVPLTRGPAGRSTDRGRFGTPDHRGLHCPRRRRGDDPDGTCLHRRPRLEPRSCWRAALQLHGCARPDRCSSGRAALPQHHGRYGRRAVQRALCGPGRGWRRRRRTSPVPAPCK